MQELLAALPDWLGVYLLTVNVAAFAVYGADKRRARAGALACAGKDIVSAGHRGRRRGGACWGCGAFTTRPGTGTSAMASRLILVVQLALAGWLWLR